MPSKTPQRNERDQRAYEHCRDNLFPLLKRMKALAQARMAAKREEEEKKMSEATQEEGT